MEENQQQPKKGWKPLAIANASGQSRWERSALREMQALGGVGGQADLDAPAQASARRGRAGRQQHLPPAPLAANIAQEEEDQPVPDDGPKPGPSKVRALSFLFAFINFAEK
jgi:hypothetical protein